MHGYLKNNLAIKGGLFFLLFIFHISLFAQSKVSSKTIITENDTLVLHAIPLSSLTQNIENAIKEIHNIEEATKPEEKMQSVDSLHLIAKENLSEENKQITEEDKTITNRSLDDAHKQWSTYKSKLGDWRTLISERSKLLTEERDEVNHMTIVWELTLEDARKEQAPKGTVLNIKDVINQLNALKNKLKSDRLDVYSKQSKLTELSKLIDETIGSIEEQKKLISKDMFIQDSPAIWNSYDSTFLTSISRTSIKQSSEDVLKSINVFYQVSKDKFYIHLLFIVILIVLFNFTYKQSLKSENDDKQFLKARKILGHPILSGLIFGFVVTFWFYPLRQVIIDELFQFLLLIVISIYLPKVINKKYSTILYFTIGLHVVNQIHLIYFPSGIILRLLTFIEIGLSFYIFKLLLDKKSPLRIDENEKKWSLLIKLTRLLQVLLIVPLLANIFGFVSLTVYLNDFIINVLINGFITLVCLLIFIGAIVLIFNSEYILVLHSVRNNTTKIIKWLIKYSSITAFLLWSASALQLLGFYDSFVKWLLSIFDLSWSIGDVNIDLGSVITFILIIFLTYLISKFVRIILKEEVFTRIKLPRGVPGATTMLVGYFIVGWGMVISVTALGINLSEFGLMAGALGVGIGFGLQSIVLNFIAGLVLAFERPIQAGDTIEVGTVMGTVKYIGVRASTVLTFDGSEVIVPNGSLISNDVINWTLSDRRKRRDIMVGVEYGTDPHLVMDILREAAKNNVNVLQDPEPWILFEGFGDSSLNFMVRFWSPMDVGLTTKSEVTIAIYDGLNKAGIKIPFPQQDLHLKSIEPEVERIILEKNKVSGSKKIKKDI